MKIHDRHTYAIGLEGEEMICNGIPYMEFGDKALCQRYEEDRKVFNSYAPPEVFQTFMKR